MKKKAPSQPVRRSLGEGGFFNIRVLIAALLCLAAVAVALIGFGLYPGASLLAKPSQQQTQQ
ncbi:MAG TPA: hypothetical protein VKD89_03005 [Candidatus Udaeobacter sp.]|nr:hypothetical protein [Candidatus Udaeobacter sp.]